MFKDLEDWSLKSSQKLQSDSITFPLGAGSTFSELLWVHKDVSKVTGYGGLETYP